MNPHSIQIDIRADGNLMPFRIFKNLFQKSAIGQLYTTKTKQCVVLKVYHNSNIEQLGICTVKLQHKDNIVKYRFFAVPGYGPALLGMLDREVIGIPKIA